MCGVGIIVQRGGRPVKCSAIKAMAAAVTHRGPDAQGIETLGPVGLAHRRLAVIDVDRRSDQPFRLGDKWLLFNGAIYNFRELRSELAATGCTFHTEGDTEVLIHALDAWGTEALSRLNGMFAFAYYDGAAERVLLARDRFGIKPLCFHLCETHLIAGSEAKQLFATGLVDARPDLASARIFLETGRTNIGEATMFAGVSHLLPGHFLELDIAGWRTRRVCWYDLAARIAPTRPDYAEAVATTRELLADAVRLRHVANVRVGAALSGGLDSTSIAALSAPVVDDPSAFAVFTTWHEGARHDERPLAAQVAKKFGFRHVEIPVDLPSYLTPDWLARFAHIHDQPLPSGSHFNEYELFRAVRDHGVTVFLDGQGSDEYFGGYGEFLNAAQRRALRGGRIDRLWINLKSRAALTGEPLWLTFRKLVANLTGKVPLTSELMEGAFVGDIPGAVENGGVLPHDFDELVIAEVTRLSIPYQLHSQDRFAMSFGIESRLPFLDYRLVEYVASLPHQYRVGKGWQKRLLRDAVAELPDDVRWRRTKNGFSAPDAEYWVRHGDAMRAMIADAVDVLAPIVDGRLILERCDAARGSTAHYNTAMFRLISLAAWVRAFSLSI